MCTTIAYLENKTIETTKNKNQILFKVPENKDSKGSVVLGICSSEECAVIGAAMRNSKSQPDESNFYSQSTQIERFDFKNDKVNDMTVTQGSFADSLLQYNGTQAIVQTGYQCHPDASRSLLHDIHEQPSAVAQALRGRLLQPPPNTPPYGFKHVKLGGLAEYRDQITTSARIVFIASGTSHHAALACTLTVEELVNVPVIVEVASDVLDRPHYQLSRNDVCVFVSYSGESVDTVHALQKAKSKGALCVGITNAMGSSIARQTTCGVHVNAGNDCREASMQAYAPQVVAITLLALFLSEDSVRKQKRREEVIQGLDDLSCNIQKVLSQEHIIRSIAANLLKSSSFQRVSNNRGSLLVLGRGYNYATARETALKMKAVAGVHSEGVQAGEMKHGPLALVDERTPVVCFATQDSMRSKMVRGALEILIARGATLVVVCNENDEEMMELEKQVAESGGQGSKARLQLIKVPRVDEALQSAVNIVPLQLLANCLAEQCSSLTDESPSPQQKIIEE